MIELDPITVAQVIATQAHAGQTYGVLPYTHHLDHVEQVLRRYNQTDPVLLVSAWLHDALEDTELEEKTVREIFGEAVAALVAAVTDEPGANRKIKKALTYPKIRKAGKKAVILKLADRIANVEMCRTKGSLLEMYRKEHEDFKTIMPDSHADSIEWHMLRDIEKLLGVK